MSDNALADLIGIDPEQLKGLLASLGPTPEMQAQADKQKWLTAGLGILAAHPGNVWNAVGQGGLLGVQAGQQSLQQQLAQRGQDLSQVMQLRQAQMQAAAMKQMQAALSEGQPQTMPGPAEPFQTQGGAAGGFQSALTGQPPSQTSLPTQVPMPANPADVRNRLANANLIGAAGGMKDLSAAIKARFPDPMALREGAGYLDANGQYHALPKPPPGFSYDPNTQSFKPVLNGQQAIATAESTPKAVGLAYEPQVGVQAGGGQGIVGNKLSALFGNGPLPFSGLQPFQGGQQPAPQSAPSGPVQTELSPEQKTNSAALGEEAAASRAAASQANKALGELGQIKQTLDYFKPGPSLPARAGIAGYAQEIPGIGSSLADTLVPNSKTALPAIAAMNKLTVGLTAEQSKVFGSREGQQVIGMIKTAQVNAGMVPGAPEVLLDSQMGIQKWFADHDAERQAWMNDPKNHGSASGFEQYWDHSHPLTSYIPDMPALKNIADGKPPDAPRNTSTSQSANSNVVQLPDGRQKVFPNATAAAAFRKAAGL